MNRSQSYRTPRPLRAAANLLASAALGAVLFSGCGEHITFEKVDLRGHVRVDRGDGDGYCFRVPSDWEIREKLEGADVVCLSPPSKGQFRESVVARTLTAQELQDPTAAINSQLTAMGEKVQIVEPLADGKPMLVQLDDTRFSSLPLSQLLFVHQLPEGNGVLVCCTTEASQMPKRRADFEAMMAKAHFDLSQCPTKGGVPSTFPTPEVTYSPGPSAPKVSPAP